MELWEHRIAGAAIVIVMSLVALVVSAPADAAQGRERERDCSQTSVGLTPLTDLGTSDYRGAQGGLYPRGANAVPPAHLAVGIARAAAIQPRDAAGNPDPDGIIAFVSIGFSNSMREFGEFQRLVPRTPDVDGHIVVVNGAQGGQDINAWVGSRGRPWRGLEQALAEAGVTAAQVQAVWIKQTVRVTGSPEPFPQGALTYRDLFVELSQNLQQHLPNLHVGYVSTRTYGGYGGDLSPSPEPGAYEEGFGAKWAMELQIAGDPALNADPAAGDVRAPWLAWGPYLWADGATARSDGLTWTCDEVRPDGAHLETEGNVKVAELLMSFLEAEPTAAWMFSNRKLPPPPTDLGQPIPTSTIAGAAPPATTEVPDATTSTTAAPPDRTTTTRAPGEAQARPPSTDENDALPPVVWILIGAGSALLFTALGIRLRERRRGRRTE